MRRLLLLGCCVLIGAPASAQAPPVLFEPASTPGFLTKIMALASVEVLNEPGLDFRWNADFGIGVDFIDYGSGRVNVTFGYENLLGQQYQPFDPRLGDYTIETQATWRGGEVEVGVLLHHVSRHLGDRAKEFGIAWNDLGVRVSRWHRRERWLWQMQGFALTTVARGFVDYRADIGGDVRVRRSLNGRLDLIASIGGHARLVRRSIFERGTQVGGRAEAGIRVAGRAGAVELVGGAERRVDADPFELFPRDWLFAGVRVVTP